jgi:hypothetical protein
VLASAHTTKAAYIAFAIQKGSALAIASPNGTAIATASTIPPTYPPNLLMSLSRTSLLASPRRHFDP